MKEGQKNIISEPTPSKMKVADKKVFAIRLYYQGHSISGIADKIKQQFKGTMLPSTVQSWIREHLEMLKESRPDVVAEFKHVELERITRLEVAYWEAWEKSQTVQVTTKEVYKAPVKVPGKRIRVSKYKPLGELESTIRETKTLTGEVRYLQGVQWCIEQRMKMLGVESGKKNEFANDESAEALIEAAEERNNVAEGSRRIVFKVAAS